MACHFPQLRNKHVQNSTCGWHLSFLGYAGATRMDAAGLCQPSAGLDTGTADEHLHCGSEPDL